MPRYYGRRRRGGRRTRKLVSPRVYRRLSRRAKALISRAARLTRRRRSFRRRYY